MLDEDVCRDGWGVWNEKWNLIKFTWNTYTKKRMKNELNEGENNLREYCNHEWASKIFFDPGRVDLIFGNFVNFCRVLILERIFCRNLLFFKFLKS